MGPHGHIKEPTSLSFYRPSPTVVTELRVPLILWHEAACEIVVRMHQRAKGNTECGEHEPPDKALTSRAVHLANKLRHVEMVLEVVPEARHGTPDGEGASDRRRQSEPRRRRCLAEERGCTEEAHGEQRAARRRSAKIQIAELVG